MGKHILMAIILLKSTMLLASPRTGVVHYQALLWKSPMFLEDVSKKVPDNLYISQLNLSRPDRNKLSQECQMIQDSGSGAFLQVVFDFISNGRFSQSVKIYGTAGDGEKLFVRCN
ncbi:MAG: hypothetical protein JNM39_10865 [Bdellovibrionaceae bacterium]|nr:hypothetical protein [Pseudobdellovibrionaceae bacterium]